MSFKDKIAAGIIAVSLVVAPSLLSNSKSDGDEFSSLLHTWADEQEELSDDITTEAVSGIEGDIVGEHEEDGSNWSIPNIIRHWILGE